MPTKIKAITLAFAVSALAAATTATTAKAEAQHFHLLGGMFDSIVDDALAANRSYYGTGDPRCPLVTTYGRYGHAVGRVHTCMLPPTWSNGILQLRSPRLELKPVQAAPRVSTHRRTG